jgi:hypothetical protein
MQTFHPPRALQPRSGLGLWCAALGPPLIWLTQFQVKYSLAPKPGAGAHVALIATSLVALALVGACGVMALRYHRLADASPLDVLARKAPRIRFMATLGLMFSALFFLLILAQFLAHFFFNPGPT